MVLKCGQSNRKIKVKQKDMELGMRQS